MPETAECVAGIKSGLKDNRSPNVTQPCASCYGNLSPCYKQPKIPNSYKPKRGYRPPAIALEGYTTYNMSYLPVECLANLRGEVRKQPGNLVASCDAMEGDTVTMLSYQPNPVVTTGVIRPCNHDMWGEGPMQNITTQRHDYVPKPNVVRASLKPLAKFHCLEAQFENKTINRMSFLDPGRCPIPAPYTPIRFYEKPIAPMEHSTTQKMSYQAVTADAPQRPPWADHLPYRKPCGVLESTTIYNASYLPPGEDCSMCLDSNAKGEPCACTCEASSRVKDYSRGGYLFPTAAILPARR